MVHLNEERVELRVATEDLKRWREAAEFERMTLSAWIREQCARRAIELIVPREEPKHTMGRRNVQTFGDEKVKFTKPTRRG